MTGFGPVVREPDEPVFHHRWEARVFAINASLMLGGHLHGTRHAIERMDGVHYLSSSYYEHWLTSATTLLVEGGVLTHAELEQRAAFPLSRPIAAEPVPHEFAGPAAPAARFAVGSRVRVRNVHPLGHTRCPDYVRDRVGEVVRVDPLSPVPELDVHQHDRVLEPVYSVRFSTEELWGEGEPGASVSVDLYERYLEDAT